MQGAVRFPKGEGSILLLNIKGVLGLVIFPKKTYIVLAVVAWLLNLTLATIMNKIDLLGAPL